jgi:hypothetical protein
MGITEFLLKLVTDEGFYERYSSSDDSTKQTLIRDAGLSEQDQLLLSTRDLTGMRIEVKIELALESNNRFVIEAEKTGSIGTIYLVPGTIYIPPPPPPRTEAS